LTDGLLHDLGLCVSSDAGLADYYRVAQGLIHWPVPKG
jgi:hypothetical protein